MAYTNFKTRGQHSAPLVRVILCAAWEKGRFTYRVTLYEATLREQGVERQALLTETIRSDFL
jgi:hypothetical protein